MTAKTPKLRKMLGCSADGSMQPLMRLIETQSLATLASWANGYIAETLVPMWGECAPDDARPLAAHEAALRCEATLASGGKPEKTLKADLAVAVRGARDAAKDAAALGAPLGPVGEAAAKAIATGSAIVSTPTNALGWTFYASAAVAYRELGCYADAEAYDAVADRVQADLLARLQSVSVADEPNPVKVDWGC